MPCCNSRDMLTGHGLIVRIESSRCTNGDSEFKERIWQAQTNQDYEQRMEGNPMD
ncbi:hypothetical protein [Arthrospira sp. PCC 8006]|uniref:hypothetical protein n=1 Tax=Oscillatoriales TaxID=1150 RepID=UPI00396F6206